MGALTRRDGGTLFPDFAELFDSPLGGLRRLPTIRIENFLRDGRCVVRAELPGVDPERDITVNVAQGALTIAAQREAERQDRLHTEFRYGSVSRTIRLPHNADEGDITASYANGILEITIGLTEQGERGRQVPVVRASP